MAVVDFGLNVVKSVAGKAPICGANRYHVRGDGGYRFSQH
jgi:hypothetical protein